MPVDWPVEGLTDKPTTWQEVMRGVEPWAGAWLWYTPDDERWTRVLCLAGGDLVEGWPLCMGAAFAGVVVLHPQLGQLQVGEDFCYPDLADPDTRRNFEARLALRLGAPPEAVDEGVMVYREGKDWTVEAGVFRGYGDAFAWSCKFRIDTDDPLLFRALAWRSVPALT